MRTWLRTLGKTWPYLRLNNRCNDSDEATADELEPVPELRGFNADRTGRNQSFDYGLI